MPFACRNLHDGGDATRPCAVHFRPTVAPPTVVGMWRMSLQGAVPAGYTMKRGALRGRSAILTINRLLSACRLASHWGMGACASISQGNER